MVRKIFLGILVFLVIACLAIILAVAFWPNQVRELKKNVEEGKPLIARKPPPRPTPLPSTPTPLPTPATQKVERRIRVKPGDFPFNLSAKAELPNGKMRITLDVKNESQKEWPVAYLTISSAYHPDRTHYRIDNWHLGELRSIDYVFPASQMAERLRDLRVEDVTSVPPAEALSGTSSEPSASSGDTSGSLEGSGALGLWDRAKKATGVPPPPPEEMAAVMEKVAPDTADQIRKGTGLTINLEGLGEIDVQPLPLEGVTGPAREVRIQYNAALKAAADATKAIKALGDIIAATPWKDAMTPDGPGTKQLEVVRTLLDSFQDKAIRIQKIHSENPTRETETLTKTLEHASETLLSYQQTLERQVRAAQPRFELAR